VSCTVCVVCRVSCVVCGVCRDKCGKVDLSLAYVVMDASWHAAYDVRVTSNDSRLNLTYYGIITNNSLDHWQDVRHLPASGHPLDFSFTHPRVSCVVCRVSCVVCRVSCVVCRVSCVVRRVVR
jgi:ferredoxin